MSMEIIAKPFCELTAKELFDIYKLRTSVFVVEQNCPYQEVDDFDLDAYHVWMMEEGQIMAYTRVIPAGKIFAEVAMGRVISVERRRGLGTKIVQAGIEVARKKLGADAVRLEAQAYAKEMYLRLGFVETSEEFLLDGIPHVEMLLK